MRGGSFSPALIRGPVGQPVVTGSRGFVHHVHAAKGTSLEDVRACVMRYLQGYGLPSYVLVDDDTGPEDHAEHRCVDLVESYLDLAISSGMPIPSYSREAIHRVVVAHLDHHDVLAQVSMAAIERSLAKQCDAEERADMEDPDAQPVPHE